VPLGELTGLPQREGTKKNVKEGKQRGKGKVMHTLLAEKVDTIILATCDIITHTLNKQDYCFSISATNTTVDKMPKHAKYSFLFAFKKW